jgi:hypothetical protein
MATMSYEDALNLLEQYEDEGDMPQIKEALRSYKGSQLRQEREQARREAEEYRTKLQSAQARLLETHFQQRGARVKPDVVKWPEDLELTDLDAVDEWGVKAGIFDARKEEIPAEEKKGIQEMSDIATDAQLPAEEDISVLMQKAQSPEEVMALARKHGMRVAGD